MNEPSTSTSGLIQARNEWRKDMSPTPMKGQGVPESSRKCTTGSVDDAKAHEDEARTVVQRVESSSGSLLKPVSKKMLNHLKEHLIVQRSDDDDEDDDGDNASKRTVTSNGQKTAPQSQMRAVIPQGSSANTPLTPTLQNVVSTVNLSCNLNLKKITFCTRNSEYNPSRFSGVIMRIREPHTTALIFSSGKVVITGARTEDDAFLAARKYARIIQKLGFNVKFQNFKIQNVVGTYDVKFPIRVENLHQKHGQFCRYEPELFPGLIYRLVKPRVVLLIFVNGKIVLTGAKCRNELKQALDVIYPVLKSFKKD